MSLTRRDLIRLFGAAALAYSVGCSDKPRTSSDAVFTGDELDVLRAFADVVIPPDDDPGGVELGAIEYIEMLLTAFDQPVPKIFAGGPFSDRNGAATNDFANFVELDRIADAAWRLTVLGSSGVTGGAPNEALLGPVVAIKDQLKQGIAAALATVVKPISEMSADERTTLFDGQPDEFRALMIELVTEAAFSAPEYGGNRNLAGWQFVHFEGDSLPLGYSQWDGTQHVERPEAPLSTANPGPDPAPLTDEVKQLLATVAQVLGGRVLV